MSTTESGDKTFSSYRGTASVKDGKPEDAHGTWTYSGGTGKFRGIKGKGTYTSSISADGTVRIEVEGEYESPPAKAQTKN